MQPELSFPTYFLLNMVTNAGWPREEGRFRKKSVVSMMVVSSTFTQLNRIGIVLGAGTPEIALKLLTLGFGRRDWQNRSVDDLISTFDPHTKITEMASGAPWDDLNPISFKPNSVKQLEETAPWMWLAEPQTEASYSTGFIRSLLWGLLHHNEARSLVTTDAAQTAETSIEAQAHGLQLDGQLPDDFESWLQNATELVDGYVEAQGALPGIEPSLLKHPLFAARMS